MHALRCVLPLRDGKTVVLRAITPQDLPAWEKMILSRSSDTLFRRFEVRSHKAVLSRAKELWDAETVVIVAELEGALVGEARLCLLPGGQSAEFCVLVADPWQGVGIGAALTDFALDLAKAMGLEKILVEIIPENLRIIDFLRRRGFRFTAERDGRTYRGELCFPAVERNKRSP